MQHKTKRPVQFEITEQTREAVTAWIAKANLNLEQYLFPSRLSKSPHITTRQYARIVHRWVESIGLDPAAYGTHGLPFASVHFTAINIAEIAFGFYP